jgi:hypothetical protein
MQCACVWSLGRYPERDLYAHVLQWVYVFEHICRYVCSVHAYGALGGILIVIYMRMCYNGCMYLNTYVGMYVVCMRMEP